MATETYGVYAYIEAAGDVVYIGKDRYIERNARKIDHEKESHSHKPGINSAIAANPKDYTYVILMEGIATKELMDLVEGVLINHFRPKFNIRMKKTHSCFLCKQQIK